MNPTGKDVTEAIKGWMNEEVKSSPSRSYELGRFLFSVSVGTISAFAAIEKLSQAPSFDFWFKLSVVLSSVSIFVSLNMARPRNWRLDGTTNLFDEHKRIIDRGIRHTVIWLLFWFIGFVAGLYSIMT